MLKNGKTVSAVVPVYNEEVTLAGIISNLLECEILDEIICVNDGSTDKSEEILESFGDKINKISYTVNQGKGFAMAEGVKASKNDLVIFLDADFTNLKCKHVNMLLKPLEDESTDAVVATLNVHKLKLILNEICGQRVYFRKDMLPFIEEMEESRWGVELLLNKKFEDKKVERVYLAPDIGHLNKHEKHAPLVAIQEYLLEGIEMAQQLMKFEKVNREDRATIKALKNVKDFMEFDRRIEKLKDKNIKDLLHEYVEKYLKIPRI